VAQAEARLAETHLTSPVDGVVLSRAVEPGDVVQPGRTVLVLARDGETFLAATPDERSLAYLAVGQEAQASADAFPRQPFPAKVTSLAPAVDADRGTIEVKLLVPSPPPFLRPGMTASVVIDVGQRAQVLVLPVDAVRDVASTSPWAMVVSGGRAVRRPLELGMDGAGLIEIRAGLAEGDRVVPPASGKIRVGQRVRVR
jgi:HlyD family secretion protein